MELQNSPMLTVMRLTQFNRRKLVRWASWCGKLRFLLHNVGVFNLKWDDISGHMMVPLNTFYWYKLNIRIVGDTEFIFLSVSFLLIIISYVRSNMRTIDQE